MNYSKYIYIYSTLFALQEEESDRAEDKVDRRQIGLKIWKGRVALCMIHQPIVL